MELQGKEGPLRDCAVAATGKEEARQGQGSRITSRSSTPRAVPVPATKGGASSSERSTQQWQPGCWGSQMSGSGALFETLWPSLSPFPQKDGMGMVWETVNPAKWQQSTRWMLG